MQITRWNIILISYLLGVVGAIQVGRVAPAASAIATRFDLEFSSLGWLISLITLPSAMLGIGVGALTVRLGLRSSLLLGCCALALLTLASAAAPNPLWLYIARLAEGLAYLIIVVAAPTLIAANAAPSGTRLALALWGTFFTAGLSLSSLFGGWWSEIWGWRAWFAWNGLLIGSVCIWAALVIPADKPMPRKEHGALQAAFVALPLRCWLLGLAFLILTFLSMMILSVLSLFLVNRFAMSIGHAGAFTGTVALAGIAGSLTYGFVASRAADKKLSQGAALLLAFCAIPAFGVELSLFYSIFFTALTIFMVGFLVAQIFAMVPRFVADSSQIGATNGLITQLGSVGALLGPPVIGGLTGAFGWETMTLVILILAALYYRFALWAILLQEEDVDQCQGLFP